MPNVKGVVLTDRDRALLAYVGIARYASAEQVHRLIAPTRSKKLVYRRLAKLCLPGGRPGEGACLRRLQYRRTEGTGVPVWALTAYGRSLVARDSAVAAAAGGTRRGASVPRAHAAPQRRAPGPGARAQNIRDGTARRASLPVARGERRGSRSRRSRGSSSRSRSSSSSSPRCRGGGRAPSRRASMRASARGRSSDC